MDMDVAVDVLDKKYVIPILLNLRDNPGIGKSELFRNLKDGNNKTIYIRLNELQAAGLIQVDTERRKHNTVLLYLTPQGQKVAAHIRDAVDAIRELQIKTES